MAPATKDVAVRPSDQVTHQLDASQNLKAANALLKHLSATVAAEASASSKRNLLADADEPEATVEAVWCILTTKKHIVDQKRLKPGKIVLPHSLNRPSASVCLIVPDPQRTFKDILDQPAFPQELASQVRILGITKLKQRYKSFESRRQLQAEYDVFLADDRVVTVLPRLLGKIFYDSPKRPLPVRLTESPSKDASGKKIQKAQEDAGKSVAQAGPFAKEVEKALGSARVHLSPSVTTAVQVGWSHFEPQQIADNVQAVVDGMVEKFVSKGWRNVRSVHIKGPNSAALPIWMSEELWVEEDDVLEEEQAERARQIGSQKGTKRKGRELVLEDDSEPKKVKAKEEGSGKAKKTPTEPEEGMSKEMLARREALRQAKREARAETDMQEQKQLKKKARQASKSGATPIAAPG